MNDCNKQDRVRDLFSPLPGTGSKFLDSILLIFLVNISNLNVFLS